MDASNVSRSLIVENLAEIHEKFPSIPKKIVVPILLKYIDLEHGERFRNVLRDLFQYNDANYTPEVLNADVNYILDIFPSACRKDITQQLRSLGKIISRVEVVVKDLLADQNKKILKRRLDETGLPGPAKRQVLETNGIDVAPRSGCESPHFWTAVGPAWNSVYGTNGMAKTPTVVDPISNGITMVLRRDKSGTFEVSGPSTSRNGFLSLEAGPDFDFPCRVPDPVILKEPEVVQLDCGNSEDEADDSMNEPEIMEITDEHEIDTRLLYHIMEMFPSADPRFLREQVKGKEFNETHIGNVVDTIFNTPNYPKRSAPSPEPEGDTINPEVKIDTLREILPDADPTYLMSSLESISTEKEFQEFVSKCLETKKYPTYKEYLRKQQLSSQVKQYTTDFSVEKFVELIPDPEAFFNSPKCKAILIRRKCDTYYYIFNFLRNRYPMLCIKQIKTIFEKAHTILEACARLESSPTGWLRSKRKTVYSLDGLTDIPLFQVFAYVEYKEEIMKYIKDRKDRDKLVREAAKANGLMHTCGCCYDDEVMPFEVATCEAGCQFCRTCVEQSVKILFYEEKLEFPCLMDCGSKFSIQTLQKTIKPKIFSKLVQKKQLQEIKAAGIEDIEFCPFCDFATILAPENKLFVCLNSDCMKESCRLCKETSHIPLRCEEIEKDEDVKNRVYIENKMTEALIRKCYKCTLTFIKEDGCNKMTCSCGAMMCYICNKPVKDYKHFNGQGGERKDLCPLYSDTNALHRDAVLKGAAIAKQELGEEVKIDPTIGVEDYYKEQMKKNPSKLPPGMR